MRVTLVAYLDGARSAIQVDVGYGDAVTPAPEIATYPVLLSEFSSPRLRVYPSYTVVAEKLDAIISLGIANSRMKDYFDLWVTIAYCRQKDHLLPLKEAMHCWSGSGSCSAKAVTAGIYLRQ